MSKEQVAQNQEFGAFLMIPHVYIDKFMPGLLESEFRVLLLILRQTIGWVDREGHTGRKERDWISMGQFAQKTGLHRESIGRAVQSLIDLGLIRVESATGVPLSTPLLRKQHNSRLYYRLANLSGIAETVRS